MEPTRSSHIMQSPQWGRFKTEFGTPAVRVGEIQYTIHKVPFTGLGYAYCPKVNPFNIKWDPLTESLVEHGCFNIKFDVPHVLKNSVDAKEAVEIFEKRPGIRKTPKSTFTQYNILLDLTKSEEELLAGMHPKHRYNIKYAQKKGVTVRHGETHADYEIFWNLQKETADRQKFLIHPKNYYQKIWELMAPEGIAKMLIAEFEGKPLAAWMLFVYESTLYYPYGASSSEMANLQASNLIGWEAIRYGKELGCTTFDMWGACKDPNDQSDPEWGFTNFKLKFGGEHVEYIGSYDLVLNKTIYNAFNFAYPKVLGLLKKLK